MLTPLELAIMRSLWRRHSARVREVQSDLMPSRRLAYTTVMTVMDRLFKKGIVRRSKRSKAHVYEPVYSESEVRSRAVEGLITEFFGGSRPALALYLQGDAHPVAEPLVDGASQPRIDDSLL